ncbi:MAG: chemotaxis protein CheW [Planctomycetota bacterium]|jgi:purine-binding chemotaxis protein CheW
MTTQLCTFFLGRDRLGIAAAEVNEVLRHGKTTPVPLAPPGVVGLVNLRGRIATVVDLRVRLGRKRTKKAPDGGSFGVVLQSRKDVVSLLVDRIGDVQEVDERTFEPPPETVPEPARSLISGTYKLKKGLVLVLDTEKAVPKYEESAD